MRARVQNGRWVIDGPADLPEGTEVEIVTSPVPKAEVYLDEKLRSYVHAIAVAFSADSRVEEALVERARAAATLANRRYVTPQDIKAASVDVLRALVVLPPNVRSRDISPDDYIRECLDRIQLP
jgi:MoxR-like ATPase